MHIPDGYLSPATCAALYGAAVPVWVVAGRRVRKVVKNRYVPLVAIGAAYSFLVMMFNVPIPDGTTAHAVGAVLIAVLLGPWAAVIAVSIALLIQALFFGDGGVLAFGANVLQHGVRHAVGRLRRLPAAALGTSSLTSPRRALAAGIGGYVGLNAAALCAAIEFGVQPTLFHAADGTPLYAPFHLAPDDPGDGARPPHGGRRRRGRAHRRRRRVPAAGQPADAAHQPRRACPRPTPSSAPPRRLGWRWALDRPRRRWWCSRRSACSRPAARSARTRPRISTCRSTT